jgi:enterochelin esterase-like enzyme
LVFLPPSYDKQKSRRYPVVYALHGYSIGAEQWSKEIHVPQTIEGAFAQGSQEVIVVLPDSKTVHNGSMYSSSVTTGDFENFIARDVVAYIDAHYRTLPNRLSRGLVGHSMGGYGATRIGMKHADVFGSLYIMSPCCLSARQAGPANPEMEKTLAEVKTAEDSAKLPFPARANLAAAAAWAPNPKNPPLYLDLPRKNGEVQPEVLAKFAANAPLAFVDQYIGNLRQYRAISIDVGDKDGLRVDSSKLHDVLDKYGIANSFDLYQGTHTSAPPLSRDIQRPSRLRQAVHAARQAMLARQRDDGHWCAELQGDTILESEYLILLAFLGKLDNPAVGKLANYIRSQQQKTGGWSNYPDGPADVSVSTKAYFALKLAGDSAADRHMIRAAEVIRELGGAEKCNSSILRCWDRFPIATARPFRRSWCWCRVGVTSTCMRCRVGREPSLCR